MGASAAAHSRRTQCYSKGPTAYTQGVAPVYLQRGHGCRVWDVDDNEFVLKSLFQQEVLRRGILWGGWHALSLSLAQDEQAVQRIIAAYERSLAVVARAVETESVREQLQGKPVKPVFRRS